MRKYPAYLLFLAAYPCISLYALNISEMNIVDLIRPLLVSISIIFLFFGLFSTITRKPLQAGITSGVLFLIFSSYGALYAVARNLELFGYSIGRHRILMSSIIILFTLGIWQLYKAKRRSIAELTLGMNIFSIVLIIFPLISITMHTDKIKLPQRSATIPTSQTTVTDNKNPDIYYIILDGYARADFIKQELNFDNSPFIDDLKKRGFDIINCGLSNYSYTRLSLATSLNMDYINELGSQFVPTELDITVQDPLIQKNKVMQILHKQGYKTVAFITGYPFSEFRDADYYFQPPEQLLSKPVMTEFEYMAIQNTIFSLISNNDSFLKLVGLDFPYYQRWSTEQFVINQIKQIPAIPGPKFVFIHLLTTHRPFIYRPDGSILNESKYYKDTENKINKENLNQGYLYGLEYTNSYMLDMIDHIQSQSKVPPVIIIQGDHGFRQPGRLSILNAISFPGEKDIFREDMTPVNTFRVIFRNLFGLMFDELPDKSFYADRNLKPFELIPTDNQNSCQIQ